MFNLNLAPRADGVLKVLCLGAHCDDIEIGCGGTLLTLLEQHRRTSVYWVVFSSDERRAEEARQSAGLFLARAQSKEVVINKFTTSFFPSLQADIKFYFEQLKRDVSPDVVFTHYRNDLHQDHRIISELTWNSFRDHLILEYEIPKFDGDLGSPNSFVHLDRPTLQKKIGVIMETFRSQREKHWFEEETFMALPRLRGVECNSPSKYAEAFYCRKMVIAPKEISK